MDTLQPANEKYAEEGDHQIQKVVTTGRKGERRLDSVRTIQEASFALLMFWNLFFF